MRAVFVNNFSIFDLSFRSVFARLYISVFLALVVFAICMFGLTQVVHNNSDTPKHHTFAHKVASEIEPYLKQLPQSDLSTAQANLSVIKKGLDMYDDNLKAKIGIYDLNKKLIVQTDNSQLPTTLTHEPTWLEETLPSIFGTSVHYVLVKMPSGYILWYESRTPPKAPTLSPFFNLFTGTILMLIIMTFVLWLIARNITRRLDEMSKTMVLLSDGDFSVRVDDDGNDEIADLAYGFNLAAQKIEQLLNAHSLLLAHASHEFRTPITRIRLQIEMLEMLSEGLSDAQRAKFQKRTHAINKDLSGLNELIESILLVSRLDAGHALEEMEKLDLYDIVAQECLRFQEQNQDISLYGTTVPLFGQPKLITHLVRNLINNAFIHGVAPVTVYVYGCQTSNESRFIPNELTTSAKPLSLDSFATDLDQPDTEEHTSWDTSVPENASFGIRSVNPSTFQSFDDDKFLERFKQPSKFAGNSKFAVLCVIDQGTGIPVDKREDIFSPFVRLKQEKKGSGLGLSLVAQIAEAHGGRIITDTWHNKTRFLVVLPIKDPNAKKHPPKTQAQPQ